MKRTDPIVASPWSPLAERLRAFAAAATELATDVELALADAGEATRTLEAMRAALGLPSAPAPVVRATAPTARPKRSAATSSNAGPSSAPTHCEAPGCGRALVQAGGRWKHYCDPKCRARSARAARDVGVVDQVVADDHAPPAPVALATIETPPPGRLSAPRAIRRGGGPTRGVSRDLRAGDHPADAHEQPGRTPRDDRGSRGATEPIARDRRAAILARVAARSGVG